MKATEAYILEFLEKAPQFEIPIYQRAYSWTKRECQQLWDDILRTGQSDEIHGHFIGSIVYIQEDMYQISSPSSLLVIDGQQRLTTIMLILESLARQLGDAEPVAGFSAQTIRQHYLTNHPKKDEFVCKLSPARSDRQSFRALMMQQPVPIRSSSGAIIQNFQFFEQEMKKLDEDMISLCCGLQKLMIVDIALNRSQDNPQLIFESMNSTGRGLSQTDLICNFILMGLQSEHQKHLYEHLWYPMEQGLGTAKYFDDFVRHYLTYKTRKPPKKRSLYEDFKKYTKSQNATEGGVESLVKEMKIFARYYCAMALDQEDDSELAIIFRDLQDLNVSAYYPLLFELYEDYSHGHLNKRDFIQILRLVEAYIFRRGVCEIPSASHGETFRSFRYALSKEDYLESVQAHFLLMHSDKRFPNDEEFMKAVKTRDWYGFRLVEYCLRRLENHGRKEIVSVDEYTIEHILPQNKNLSDEWQQALGSDWREVQDAYLHKLGNLTLTGYNSEYGDRPFAEKRDMPGGFRHSPLKLNQGLGNLETWNADEIEKRAQRLAGESVRIWESPVLPRDILGTYRVQQAGPLGDCPHLVKGSPIRALFDVLREEILSLDPCVKEGIYRNYINYKARSRFIFAGVKPLEHCLLIDLRIPFEELEDPECMAMDYTDRQYPGLDAKIDLHDSNKLPYIMGLVHQAFKKGML